MHLRFKIDQIFKPQGEQRKKEFCCADDVEDLEDKSKELQCSMEDVFDK